MATGIAVKFDSAALERKLQQKMARVPRATAAGLNRAAQGGLTLSVREVQKDIGATAQKTIRRNLTVSQATAQKPEAKIIGFSSKKDRVPIYEMRPKPRSVTKRRPAGGVRYGPEGKQIPGSFIAALKSGHVGVFKRLGARRLPIRELFGPSVALVFSRKKIQKTLLDYLKTKVPEELKRAFKFVA